MLLNDFNENQKNILKTKIPKFIYDGNYLIKEGLKEGLIIGKILKKLLNKLLFLNSVI